MMKNIRTDIRDMRSYLLLWSTQLISGLGSAMTAYALVIWSYTQTGSALRTAAKIQGIDYYFVQVYDFNLGGSYGAILTAASYYTDRTQEVLDMFTPLS